MAFVYIYWFNLAGDVMEKLSKVRDFYKEESAIYQKMRQKIIKNVAFYMNTFSIKFYVLYILIIIIYFFQM